MRKLGFPTIVSVALNIILTLWLVQQYFSDDNFRSFVNGALGPVYPFIILTAGVGGGSSFGYFLLRRRHAGETTQRPEKPRLFKPGSPLRPGGLSSTLQSKIMSGGASAGQVTRHTAYAVPSLPRGSGSSGIGARGAGPSATSVGSKAATASTVTFQRESPSQPSTSLLNSALRDQYRPEPTVRQPQNLPPQPLPPSRVESIQPANRIPLDPSRATPPPLQWKPEPSQQVDRGQAAPVFQRPGPMDMKPGAQPLPYGSNIGQVPQPPQASQTPFTVSKWVAPEQKTDNQWTDPVPRPGPGTSQKWAPPPSPGLAPGPQQGIPPRPPSGQLPGPGPGSTGQRPPPPAGQGGPRPLGYPNYAPPGQPGPLGVSKSFRPDQPRPVGPPSPGRPVQPQGGSLPQPWSPSKPSERPDSGGATQDKGVAGSPIPRSPQLGASDNSSPSGYKPIETSPTGGEMDWDTALDTILKTLKKDRGVGERT